jgi:acyl-CoA reductase-like NAD-dependent aldehyde dehydrogenase
MVHYPLMIPGAKESGKLDVTAPFDGTAIATVGAADAAAVEIALATAERLYLDRDNWLPRPQRIEILKNTARLMKEQRGELALLAAREGGKPLSDSQVEVDRAIDGVELCIEELRSVGGREIPMNVNAASAGRMAFTRLFPIGPVVAVSAFNHPLNLIVHQVAPAVATGCPVVVKPAEDTPLSCFRFVEILRNAGLPEQWCQALVVNDVAVAEKLVTDPSVAFFSFIGSAKVGWMLRSRLAAGTRCALEHGGAAPVIMTQNADLESALPLLAKGGYYHAGQVCVSVQRVFAHRSIVKNVADGLVAQAENIRVGDPTSAETDVGPLIRYREVDRIAAWVEKAGGSLLCGGQRLSASMYAPTVLLDPNADAEVSTREIFGPVLCVYPYDAIDDAVARANALPYAFQAAVFSNDLEAILRIYARIEASAVMVNDHTAFRVDWMPFTGLKQSGLGVGGIPYTMHDMQIEKMLVTRSSELI